MHNNELSRRAKNQLPTVLLTLLSIVQALALELLWAHITQQSDLYAWSYIAVLCWLQIGATLLGVLLIWLIYGSLVMRFRWVPSTADSVFPFIVGIIEFSLIETLGPNQLGPWFLILALIFAMMAWLSQETMRRARLDGENDAFFGDLQSATLKDHYPIIGTVTILAVIGIYLWLSGEQGWIAMCALIFAATALSIQMWLTDVYWRRSLAKPIG